MLEQRFLSMLICETESCIAEIDIKLSFGLSCLLILNALTSIMLRIPVYITTSKWNTSILRILNLFTHLCFAILNKLQLFLPSPPFKLSQTPFSILLQVDGLDSFFTNCYCTLLFISVYLISF